MRTCIVACLAARAAGALFGCQDIKGATNCTDHEALGVHTCEWCASEQVCHEVDSYFNTCADKCCASKSPLSTCDAKNASDLDVERCENTPGAATCEDIESAEACLDHTRAELHVCEYCASTDSCHEVDSPLDSCATACCASRGVASLCDHDDSADIDFKKCSASFELNATVWQNAGTAYAWPEDDVEAVASKPSVGVAFSGGGTRSYAASVGVAQALEALGLLSKIKYMSGVSGGSWFVSALAYDQSDDEAALLCPYAPPSNLTLEYLADLPAGCMADATTYNFIGEVVAKAAGDIFDKEELFSTVWEEVVDEAIFRPRGIASKSRAALSAKAAEDARARSPNLAAYPFVWPRRLDAVPFPISSGTLLGPVALAPYARHNRSFTIVQHTPIYSGNPYTSTVTYNSQDGCDDDDHCVTATDAVRVGGLFSAYAYGADVPLRNGSLAPGQRSGELAVLAPKDGATVQRAAAMSSMAPAAWFANESPELLGVTLSEEYAYAPDAPAESARLFYTGDGGVLENNGLIPLLQRGLERVVVFANTLTPLADRAAWDPAARAPTASDIDANIPALFGIVVEDAPSVIDVAVGTDYSSIQVFRPEDFPAFAAQLQDSLAAGGGAIADATLETVANAAHGVVGGRAVRLGFCMFAIPTVAANFVAALANEDVKQAVADAADGKGGFANFPAYDTFTQMSLSGEQALLLLSYTSFLVRDNAAWFEAMLG